MNAFVSVHPNEQVRRRPRESGPQAIKSAEGRGPRRTCSLGWRRVLYQDRTCFAGERSPMFEGERGFRAEGPLYNSTAHGLRRNHYWRQLCGLICSDATGAGAQASSTPGFRKTEKPLCAVLSWPFRPRWATAFGHSGERAIATALVRHRVAQRKSGNQRSQGR